MEKKVKSIIILSHEEELHAKHIYKMLKAKSENISFLDWRKFPSKIQLAFSPTQDFQHKIILDGQEIYPKSIYWRWYHSPFIDNKSLANDKHTIAYKDANATVKEFMDTLKCLWVNPPKSYYLHWCKPKQLAKFKKYKIPLPKTLITNDNDSIRDFMTTCQNVIYKPVQGGYHTQRLFLKDLSSLENALRTSPITIQEYIEGKDIRVYIIGETLYSMEICSKSTDFREDKDHQIIPIDIPDSIKKMCYQVAKISNYIFTAIDIKKSKSNEYFFLEANPSPMFVHVEKVTGYPISEKLCELLIKG